MTLKPFSQVINDLRALATAKPEMEAACQYFADEDGECEYRECESATPCCIVGHFLVEQGVTRSEFGELVVGSTVIGSEGGKVDHLNWSALGYRKPGVRQEHWVKSLQGHQDSHEAWGDALVLADRDRYEA